MSTFLPLDDSQIVVASNSLGMSVWRDANTLYTEGAWPDQLAHQAKLIGINLSIVNASHGGWTIEQLTNVARTEVDAVCDRGAASVCVVHEGTNRLFLNPALTAQQVYQETADYCYLRRSLGYHVIVITTLPRSETPSGQTLGQFQAKLEEYNRLLMANWKLFADKAIDIRQALPQLVAGSEYLPDGTHLSPTAAGLLAGVVLSHLRSVRFRPIAAVGAAPLVNWALMPNIPVVRRPAIETALTNAAAGQSYTAQDIFAVLATASHWWSLEAAGTYSDTAATTPATQGGTIAAAKDWVGGVLLTQATAGLRPTLSSAGATFTGANDSNLNGAFALTNNTAFTAFAVSRPLGNKNGAILKTGFTTNGSAGWSTGMGTGNLDSPGYESISELGWVSWIAGWNSLPSYAQCVSGFQRSGGSNIQYINGSRVWSVGGAMQPVGAFTAIGGYGTRCVNAEISSAIAFQSVLTTLQNHQINRFLIAYYNPSADIDAVIYGGAANATQAQYNAIDALARALKSNGTWAKYQAIYPLFGDSNGWKNSSLNIKRPLQDTAAYQIAWSGSITHAANGIAATGNGYGNTNYKGVIRHVAIWTHGSEANDQVAYGRIKLAAPAEWSTAQLRSAGGPLQVWSQGNAAFSAGTLPAGDPGLISVTADQGQPVRVYQNGAIFATGAANLATAPSNPTNLDYYLLAANLDSSPYGYSNRRTSFFAISDQYFTAAEIAADYTAIAAFQTAMGR